MNKTIKLFALTAALLVATQPLSAAWYDDIFKPKYIIGALVGACGLYLGYQVYVYGQKAKPQEEKKPHKEEEKKYQEKQENKQDSSYVKRENDLSIHDAAISGNIDRVKELLDKDKSLINTKDKEGATPLHYAAFKGRSDIVSLLIDNGADINAKNKSGKTPLDLAKKQKNHSKVVKLLESAAEKEREKTLLSNIEKSDWRTVKQSVRKYPDLTATLKQSIEKQPSLFYIKDQHGTTLLHYYATEEGDFDVAKLLIENSHDVNVKDNNGKTPLHLAAETDKLKIAGLLIENGADSNAKDNNGNTPLDYAKQNKNNDIVKLLDSAANSINQLGNNEPISSEEDSRLKELFFLIKNQGLGHLETIKQMLIDHPYLVNAKNKYGSTPLHIAAIWNNSKASKLLIDNGANPNVRNNVDNTPLDDAFGFHKNHPFWDDEESIYTYLKRATDNYNMKHGTQK